MRKLTPILVLLVALICSCSNVKIISKGLYSIGTLNHNTGIITYPVLEETDTISLKDVSVLGYNSFGFRIHVKGKNQGNKKFNVFSEQLNRTRSIGSFKLNDDSEEDPNEYHVLIGRNMTDYGYVDTGYFKIHVYDDSLKIHTEEFYIVE